MEAVRVKIDFTNVKFHARILWSSFFRTVGLCELEAQFKAELDSLQRKE